MANIKILAIVLFVVIIGAAVLGAYEMEIGPFEEDEDDDDDNGGQIEIIDERPVAVIAKDKTHADVDEGINFDGSDSYDDESNITGYSWDFDDGNSAENMTANHNWTSPGAYNVTLTVEDTDGNTNVTWTWIGVTYRLHDEGNTNGATEAFDFDMVELASKLHVNTTLSSGDADVGEKNVTIRISFEGTVVDEQTVTWPGGGQGQTEIGVAYTNWTNLTAGTWTWELIVNDSGVVCDIDWEAEIVILYA